MDVARRKAKNENQTHPLLLDELETLREMLMDGRLGSLFLEMFLDDARPSGGSPLL